MLHLFKTLHNWSIEFLQVIPFLTRIKTELYSIDDLVYTSKEFNLFRVHNGL